MKTITITIIFCVFSVATFASGWKPVKTKTGNFKTVVERLKYDSYMAPYFSGKILPTPQKVSYGKNKYPLDNTGIVLGKDLSPQDKRVELLLERIKKYGGKYKIISQKEINNYPTLICLGDTGLGEDVKPPEKPEGYVVKCFQQNGRNFVIMKSYDFLGLTWAIYSLNQMINFENNKTTLTEVNIKDYPFMKRRMAGVSIEGRNDMKDRGARTISQSTFLQSAFKFNEMLIPYSFLFPRRGKYHYWRDKRPEWMKKEIQEFGKELNPLGIKWYAGFFAFANSATASLDRQIDCKSEKDFQHLMEIAEWIGDAGGNITFYWEDYRFPIGPADEKNFGSAREADVYFLNKMYKELRKKYPKMQFMVCPMFYWGPDGGTARYSESREKYLKALGERLPKDFDIFWTGPRVKSRKVNREHMKWITGLIKRKPVYWQNSTDVMHIYYFHYMTDPIRAWKNYYYNGFYNDIKSYFFNFTPGNNVSLITNSDYQWNPLKYNPEECVRQAVEKIVGRGAFEKLDKLNKTLTYFDKYDAKISPSAAKNIKTLEKKLSEAQKLYNEIFSQRPAATKWNYMPWVMHLCSNYLVRLKKSPALEQFSKMGKISLEKAKKEAKLNPEKDIFLSAFNFSGGYPARTYVNNREKRYATWIYGNKSTFNTMKGDFQIEPFPPLGHYKLIISGQDDDSKKKCRIKITMNGKKIFEGPAPFVSKGWSMHTFHVPANTLNRYNVLSITTLEDKANKSGPPFFMLNYAILRKTAK